MKKLAVLAVSLGIIVLVPSLSFAGGTEALDAMKSAREKLVALLDTTDKGTQKVLVDEIHKASAEADAKLTAAINDPAASPDQKAKYTEAKTVWDQFKETRESQIIPAVLAGKPEDGKTLAKGIQADRFKKVVTLLQ